MSKPGPPFEQQAPWRQGVAIIIPAHNYGRFLRQATESALQQSIKPAQIVIVDDGSTDDTPVVAAQLALENTSVRVIRHSRPCGLTCARLSGLQETNTPYVCFLDADDSLSKGYLDSCLKALADPSAGFAYPSVHHFGSYHAFSEAVPGTDRQLSVRNPFPSSSVIRREALEACGAPSSGLEIYGVEDWEMWLRIVAAGFHGVPAPEAWLNYRRHDRPSRNVSRLSYATWIRALYAIHRANPATMPTPRVLLAAAVGWRLAVPTFIGRIGRRRRLQGSACQLSNCNNTAVT